MSPKNRPEYRGRQFQTPQLWMIIAVIIVLIVNFFIYLSLCNRNTQPQAASLPQLAEAVEAGQVRVLAVQGDLLTVYKSDGTSLSAIKESSLSALETLQILGVSPEALAELPVVVETTDNQVNSAYPLLFIVVLSLLSYWAFQSWRREQRSNSDNIANDMRHSNPRILSGAGNSKGVRVQYSAVTFKDVAGVDSAKVELQEMVEFLKNPIKFSKLGAHVPRGVLMAGPPGTGKTLLAKAVAGEASVPFFSISGSEFVEMYVGVGASRVRDLFERARDLAPAIIFVDEIDAVGRQRGVTPGNGSDEREQTLNQILVEMDGVTTDTNIVVIAATNRPDILDPALLRPGRFDRKVILDRPDVEDREAILNVHVRHKPLAADISITDLARLTPGFAGADLENLVNEAAILAARRNLAVIGRQEFQDAMERIVAGPERKTKLLSDYERRVVAYHEAGHAVVMHNLEHSDPVHKVSIISRGMALGYTMPLPEGDKYLRPREAFEDELVGLLGGRAAEEVVFKHITTGAANDLDQATRLARAMVTRYGFSEKLGLRTFGDEQGNPFLGNLGEIRDYSEEMARIIDQEIRFILDKAYQRATDIIIEQRGQLEALAKALLEYETVERASFESLMAQSC